MSNLLPRPQATGKHQDAGKEQGCQRVGDQGRLTWIGDGISSVGAGMED
jgi:hypothetical protein